MKKANFIINHIKASPSHSLIRKHRCYKKLLQLLPQSLQNNVRFMYNKHDILFFVVEHPVYKMEFDYKTSLIKGLLKELIKHHEECTCINASKIKTFVTNKPKYVVTTKDTLPIYKEKSKATFANRAKNKKLYDIFEEIRKCIQNLPTA